ncbi:hypothetical protein [Effusibacillus consociatus]|uniref:hypothetical protein n=1 Tax=Effusibacillus consociatus TaxID=1117041 RepID=UPI0036D2907E
MVSFFAAIWMIRRDLDRAGSNGGQVADVFWWGLFLGLIVYRFGGAIVDPISLFRNPLQVLLSVPVPFTKWLGVGAGAVYLLWKLHRMSINSLESWKSIINWTAPGILVGISVYQWLVTDIGRSTSLPWGMKIGEASYHPIHLYKGIGLLLTAFWVRRKAVEPQLRIGWALLGVGVAMMAVSFFRFPEDVWFGLTLEQWGYLAISISGLLYLSIGRSDRNRKVLVDK